MTHINTAEMVNFLLRASCHIKKPTAKQLNSGVNDPTELGEAEVPQEPVLDMVTRTAEDGGGQP